MRLLRQALRAFLFRLLPILLVWSFLEAHYIHHRLSQAAHDADAGVSLSRNTSSERKPLRVFIASIHWNNEKVLRSDWNEGVLGLVKELGGENVFVSVYESGSWDNTKGALRDLDRELEGLGVAKQITLDQTTHEDLRRARSETEGWAKTPEGRVMPRRIPFLARLRNVSLQPLLDMARNGTAYDHVLFLGDVVFTVRDVLALLNTNDGRYAAACSLDFSKPPRYYDTFALRDADHHGHASQTWPYFRSSKSRDALIRAEPVPVSSCWNGIVSMPSSAFTGTPRLPFRGIADDLAELHLEGSECCLIHADNPASQTSGVYLNPNVRVGYSRAAYSAVHPHSTWPSVSQIWRGMLDNRLARLLTTPYFKEWYVRRVVAKWQREMPGRDEKGTSCLINEMQVLVDNGWAHL